MYSNSFKGMFYSILLLVRLCLAEQDCRTTYVTVTETVTTYVPNEASMGHMEPTKAPTAPELTGTSENDRTGPPKCHFKFCGHGHGKGHGCHTRVLTYHFSNSSIAGPTSFIRQLSSPIASTAREKSISSSILSTKLNHVAPVSDSSSSAASLTSAVPMSTPSPTISTIRSTSSKPSTADHTATSTIGSLYVSSSTSTSSFATTAVAPSSSSSTSSASSELALPTYPSQGSYEDKVLYSHNIHRVNHSVSDLVWNQTLAYAAYTWATRCYFRHNTSLLPGGYGQNLAASSPTASISVHISDYWYNNEIKFFAPYYGFPNPGESSSGHFSQIVWKNTVSVGCATVNCRYSSLGMWYTVCNYYPPGNWGGQYGANVLVPIGNPVVRGIPSDIIMSNSW